MKYSQFRSASVRSDGSANNRVHFFSHFFSTECAYLFFRLGLTPNAVTFLFLILGCLSAFSFHAGFPIIAYALWRLHIIVDMADGTVARATGVYSKSADGFDKSNHIVINMSVIFATGIVFNNYFVLLLLTISFLLSYNFSRNYFAKKTQTANFSLVKNVVKSSIGLEGYILVSVVISIVNTQELQIYFALTYSFFFFIIYLMKLRSFVYDQ